MKGEGEERESDWKCTISDRPLISSAYWMDPAQLRASDQVGDAELGSSDLAGSL